jgi:hypothetical protein
VMLRNCIFLYQKRLQPPIALPQNFGRKNNAGHIGHKKQTQVNVEISARLQITKLLTARNFPGNDALTKRPLRVRAVFVASQGIHKASDKFNAGQTTATRHYKQKTDPTNTRQTPTHKTSRCLQQKQGTEAYDRFEDEELHVCETETFEIADVQHLLTELCGSSSAGNYNDE